MKIGILGDIHGNLEALKVAHSALVEKNIGKIYHLGDLGGYAPFVNEVIDFLIEHDIEGVMGNYDDALVNNKEHCGCKYEDPLQAEMATLSFNWTKRHISQKSLDYMKRLPFEILIKADEKKVKLFHATPIKNNLYWYDDREEDFFLHMARKANADIMIYGHTHIPYRKNINNKIFINAGSVGKPKDGDIRTCACIVDITNERVLTEFLRIPYDIEKTISGIIESGLPPYFAERLRLAK